MMAELAGLLASYNASVPAPRFLVGSKGAGGLVQQTLTYGATIALEFLTGDHGIVTITDANAFVFAAPTFGGTAFGSLPTAVRSGLAGTQLRLTYRNAAGVAHGAGTFNAAFKTSGALAAVATGFNRSLCFVWDGSNWIEQWRTAADVAN